MPSGIAVSASPKLWIRSARSATIRSREDRGLQRGEPQHGEADRDGAHPVARTRDRAVDQPVRVPVAAVPMPMPVAAVPMLMGMVTRMIVAVGVIFTLAVMLVRLYL